MHWLLAEGPLPPVHSRQHERCAVKARVDAAWHAVAARTPHICGALMGRHGLEKTGEDIFERGRRAVVYYECNEASDAELHAWFAKSRKWLSHRLGEELRLKCAASRVERDPAASAALHAACSAICCLQARALCASLALLQCVRPRCCFCS
jgi:hypothetical protein